MAWCLKREAIGSCWSWDKTDDVMVVEIKTDRNTTVALATATTGRRGEKMNTHARCGSNKKKACSIHRQWSAECEHQRRLHISVPASLHSLTCCECERAPRSVSTPAVLSGCLVTDSPARPVALRPPRALRSTRACASTSASCPLARASKLRCIVFVHDARVRDTLRAAREAGADRPESTRAQRSALPPLSRSRSRRCTCRRPERSVPRARAGQSRSRGSVP